MHCKCLWVCVQSTLIICCVKACIYTDYLCLKYRRQKHLDRPTINTKSLAQWVLGEHVLGSEYRVCGLQPSLRFGLVLYVGCRGSSGSVSTDPVFPFGCKHLYNEFLALRLMMGIVLA